MGYAILRGEFIFLAGAFFTAAAFGVAVAFLALAVFFSATGFSAAFSSVPSSSAVASLNFISILLVFNKANHFTIFFISLPYTLSKSISGYTFSKYAFMALGSALFSGNFSALAFMAVKTSTRFTLSFLVYTSILSRCEKLCTRVLTNFVLLSSRERTIPPSALEDNNSNKPPMPVTDTNLLYSMI